MNTSKKLLSNIDFEESLAEFWPPMVHRRFFVLFVALRNTPGGRICSPAFRERVPTCNDQWNECQHFTAAAYRTLFGDLPWQQERW